MKHTRKALLALGLTLPGLALAQLSPPDGLTDYLTHNFDQLGTGGTDSGDNTTVWVDDPATSVAQLNAAGYTVINGSGQGTRIQSTAGVGGMIRLSNRDDSNVVVNDIPVGLAVDFPGAQDKGYVSLAFNFIDTTETNFFIELLSGTDVVASLNLTTPVPDAASDAAFTSGTGTTNLASVGFSNYFSTTSGGATYDPNTITPVEFAWEGGLVDFYFGDFYGLQTTLSGEAMDNGATSVTAFRVFTNVPSPSGDRTRMRFDRLEIDLAVVPEPSTVAAVLGAFALVLVLVSRRKGKE